MGRGESWGKSGGDGGGRVRVTPKNWGGGVRKSKPGVGVRKCVQSPLPMILTSRTSKRAASSSIVIATWGPFLSEVIEEIKSSQPEVESSQSEKRGKVLAV